MAQVAGALIGTVIALLIIYLLYVGIAWAFIVVFSMTISPWVLAIPLAVVVSILSTIFKR
jgi:hypothetical protein